MKLQVFGTESHETASFCSCIQRCYKPHQEAFSLDISRGTRLDKTRKQLTPTGKPPSLEVRFEKILPFRR